MGGSEGEGPRPACSSFPAPPPAGLPKAGTDGVGCPRTGARAPLVRSAVSPTKPGVRRAEGLEGGHRMPSLVIGDTGRSLPLSPLETRCPWVRQGPPQELSSPPGMGRRLTGVAQGDRVGVTPAAPGRVWRAEGVALPGREGQDLGGGEGPAAGGALCRPLTPAAVSLRLQVPTGSDGQDRP